MPSVVICEQRSLEIIRIIANKCAESRSQNWGVVNFGRIDLWQNSTSISCHRSKIKYSFFSSDHHSNSPERMKKKVKKVRLSALPPRMGARVVVDFQLFIAFPSLSRW